MKWSTKTPSHLYMNLKQLLSNLSHYHGIRLLQVSSLELFLPSQFDSIKAHQPIHITHSKQGSLPRELQDFHIEFNSKTQNHNNTKRFHPTHHHLTPCNRSQLLQGMNQHHVTTLESSFCRNKMLNSSKFSSLQISFPEHFHFLNITTKNPIKHQQGESTHASS